MSEISKRSALRNQLKSKLRENQAFEEQKDADEYGAEDCGEGEGEADAMTVATSAVDDLSVAPTEVLAQEYQRLMNQYDNEIHTREELEDKIEKIKRETA